MSVEKVARTSGEVVWRVRWRQHGHNRARTFSSKRDARDFDAEVRRQRRAGGLAVLDAGSETLGEYVTDAWAGSHAVTLAPKTRLHYASLYDHHVRPYLGSVALRDITPELIGRWQAERLAGGAGPVAVRHAMELLGSILEHAFIAGRLTENPARRVKKARRPRREEVRPLSPAQSRRCEHPSVPATEHCSPSSPTREYVRARRSGCDGETSASEHCSFNARSHSVRRPTPRRASIARCG